PRQVGLWSQGVSVGGKELGEIACLAVWSSSVPGAQTKAFNFNEEKPGLANGPGYWRLETGLEPQLTNGWLVFLDPFHLDCEAWLKSWNEAYAPVPVLGGLTGGSFSEQLTQLHLNGEVFEEGRLAVAVADDVGLVGVTCQGCTPIGDTWTLTKVEQNIIHKIANRPAYEVLAETFNQLPTEEQKKARGNLFIGLVVNEYLDEFHRGDFLIRNLLGADP